jgi:hypothetical protein
VYPGHPFTREGEHDVAVLEFGCHCNQGKISHPKERHPRIRREWMVNRNGLTRTEVGDFVAYRTREVRDDELLLGPSNSPKSFWLFTVSALRLGKSYFRCDELLLTAFSLARLGRK